MAETLDNILCPFFIPEMDRPTLSQSYEFIILFGAVKSFITIIFTYKSNHKIDVRHSLNKLIRIFHNYLVMLPY